MFFLPRSKRTFFLQFFPLHEMQTEETSEKMTSAWQALKKRRWGKIFPLSPVPPLSLPPRSRQTESIRRAFREAGPYTHRPPPPPHARYCTSLGVSPACLARNLLKRAMLFKSLFYEPHVQPQSSRCKEEEGEIGGMVCPESISLSTSARVSSASMRKMFHPVVYFNL